MKRFPHRRQWTPINKNAAPRYPAPPRPTIPRLEARIEAARMTAIGLLRLAEQAEEGSVHRERLRSSASNWEAKAVELERLKRGKQTLTIVLP